MRRLPTASALRRALACGASEALPTTRSTSEYAERGTAVHLFVQRAREVGRDAALAEVDADASHRALCEALPLGELPAGGSLEVPLAWDHETDAARVLTSNGHRDYADARPTEYCGTGDYVGRIDDAVIVIDWKSGRRWLGPARDSAQLRLLALAAARVAGVESARVAYFFLRDDGSYAAAWASFDAFDLAAIAEELRAFARRTPTADDVHEGEWCTYCPAYYSCSAKARLALAIGAGNLELTVDPAAPETLTPERMAAAYLALERYDDVADRARRAIRDAAAMHPLDLGDGRVLEAVDWPTTTVDADAAHAIVAAERRGEIADQTFPRRATVAAVMRLGGKELLERLERAGAVRVITARQVRAHRRK